MAKRIDVSVPPAEDQYLRWLQARFRGVPGVREGLAYYEAVTASLKLQVEGSEFWLALQERIDDYDASYFQRTGMRLSARPHPGTVEIKPWLSFVSKAYRINVVGNANFPLAPKNDWLLPDNYFERVADVIRTTFVVKYLDGIEELGGRIQSLADELGLSCEAKLRGTPAGYYGGHYVIGIPLIVTSPSIAQAPAILPTEIQVTTQVKEVLKELIHKDYSKQRLLVDDDLSWQWQFESRPFAANYLGHVLHYVEGRIMNIRRMDEAEENDVG
jgi:ppGpp synthetase/RelA/SpoT-type nucleotidyltranferase